MIRRDMMDEAVPTTAPALRRSAWNSTPNRMLFLLCFMYLIFYIDRVNISTAAPLIKSDLGLSNTALGFAFSAFAYPYAVFQLIGGWLGDRFGPRWTLGASGLVVCISTAPVSAVETHTISPEAPSVQRGPNLSPSQPPISWNTA